MQAYYIDTNAILRFILKDNPEQYQASKSLFERASRGDANIIVLNEVLVELSYVLIKVYKLQKDECVNILLTLIESEHINLACEDKTIMISALSLYKGNNIDIVDAILYAYAQAYDSEVFTFDKALKSLMK